MRVLVSGASGLIGSALCEAFRQRGDDVAKLVRKEWSSSGNEILWDPAAPYLERGKIEGFDAAIHLSGENVGSGRWTERKKGEIIESRIRTTRLLARTFLELECRQCEDASHPARDKGIRVINTRFGLVMGGRKSPFTRMLLPFKLGLGGPVGPGTQYLSWITLHDAVRALLHVLATPSFEGPVNVVSPSPVRNKEFVSSLGRALNRPAVLPLPAFAARLLLGEMADDLLLASQRVIPRKLLESGFTFEYPELEQAIRHVLESR